MIQYQKELVSNIKKVIPLQSSCYIQKIYSSSTLVCLSARLRGKTWFFYLGRGNGVEGFWVADERIPAELRRTDSFLEYLRKHLSSTELLNIIQVFNDRCLHIIYRKYGYEQNSFIFFWKGRKLYFLNYFFDDKNKKFCLMKSWQKKEMFENEVTKDDLYKTLRGVGVNQEFSGHFKDSTTSIITIIKNEKEKLKKLNTSRRKMKSLKKKLSHICDDLKKIEDAFELQEKLKVREFSFDEMDTELVFKSFKVKFSKGLGPFQKRNRVFEKIKSYKRAKKILEERKLRNRRRNTDFCQEEA